MKKNYRNVLLTIIVAFLLFFQSHAFCLNLKKGITFYYKFNGSKTQLISNASNSKMLFLVSFSEPFGIMTNNKKYFSSLVYLALFKDGTVVINDSAFKLKSNEQRRVAHHYYKKLKLNENELKYYINKFSKVLSHENDKKAEYSVLPHQEFISVRLFKNFLYKKEHTLKLQNRFLFHPLAQTQGKLVPKKDATFDNINTEKILKDMASIIKTWNKCFDIIHELQDELRKSSVAK